MCNTDSKHCHLLLPSSSSTIPEVWLTFVSVGTTSLKLTNVALLRLTEQVILETSQVTFLLILSYWKCRVRFAPACHIVYKQYELLYSPMWQ